MANVLDYEACEAVDSVRDVTVVLKVSASEVEVALNTRGASLQRPLITAIIAAMTVEKGAIDCAIG